MDYYRKAKRVIEKLISNGKREFILFPFGERGLMIKNILNNQYGIKEEYILDNKLSKLVDTIHPIEYLAQLDLNRYLILLTSDNEECYSEIRTDLMKYAGLDQFVDVFSTSMYWDDSQYYEKPTQKHPRLIALEAAAKEIYRNEVEGAIAECGVYKGWFANHMSRFMPDRKIYLFDTFNGFDDRDIDEKEDKYSGGFREKNKLSDTSVELALSNLGFRANAIVRKGYFPDTAIGLEQEKFAFVSLDTDLYKPILSGLEFFYPRLSPGGYIFVDDLGHEKLQGVRQALLDFCKKEEIGYVPIFDGTDETAIIAKPV